MQDDQAGRRKTVKVGCVEGGGPPPGYEWNVLILDRAHQEASVLDASGYHYLKEQIQELARHIDPKSSSTLRLESVRSFFELKEKGGPLGKSINIRVFFDVDEDSRTIRILGFIKKKNDRKTSPVVVERILRRQRRWNSGEYPSIEVLVKNREKGK